MFGETESKYLAGLLDADGCLTFVNNQGYLHMTMELSMSESIDIDGKYAQYLSSKVGKLYTRKREDNWAIQNSWVIRKRNDLEAFLPHVIKHMVVKGAKWNRMLEIFRSMKAERISDVDLRDFREETSLLLGPVKHKNHPTWAWVAGYIDGDGWYLKRVRPKQIEMHVGAVSHLEHGEGLRLLHKAFGGVLKNDRGHLRWIKNLGPRDKKFAVFFLKKMVNHSKLKRWKIEQMLSTYSQRLSVSTSTEDAIV